MMVGFIVALVMQGAILSAEGKMAAEVITGQF